MNCFASEHAPNIFYLRKHTVAIATTNIFTVDAFAMNHWLTCKIEISHGLL